MKLFIWENVLTDYTSGMAIAYAPSLEIAMSQFETYIAKELGSPTTIIDCKKSRETFVTYVYGGG